MVDNARRQKEDEWFESYHDYDEVWAQHLVDFNVIDTCQ